MRERAALPQQDEEYCIDANGKKVDGYYDKDGFFMVSVSEG